MTQKRYLQKLTKWIGVTVGYFSHFYKKLIINTLNKKKQSTIVEIGVTVLHLHRC